jgi:hypothetical protein
MSFMDKILEIKKEITEKKGKEWLGLQVSTEKQLESILWYLDHPKLQEHPKLLNEIIESYFAAKRSRFVKMEGIIRKLDQLSITLGKHDYTEKEEVETQPKFLNYVQAIKELKRKIEILMESPLGTSLPDNIQEALLTFLNYLNHPDLHRKPKLFDKMYEVYESAKKSEFLKMQNFNDMLMMLEIKLGEITEEMKKYKTIDEKRQELEQEQGKLLEEWELLKKEQEKISREKLDLAKEKENIREERVTLNTEKEEIRKIEKKMKEEQKLLKNEKMRLTNEWNKLENVRKTLDVHLQKFEELQHYDESNADNRENQ